MAVDGTCNFSQQSVVVYTDGYFVVQPETLKIKSALNQRPVAVAIRASEPIFTTYQSGVITSADCGTEVNHGVLAVGYGEDYYIVKNSWGTSWGEAGYVKIGFGDGAGVCGINQYVAYP